VCRGPALTGPAGTVAPNRGMVLAVCCIGLFMTGLDTTIVAVALPSMAGSLHAGISGMQWAAAAYTVTLASLLTGAGALADWFGRRTVFQCGLALFTLGSWLCSLAPGLSWLIGFRVLQGAGGSMLNPAALGIITSIYPQPAERARAIGAWDGVFGISMAAGPVAGGILTGCAGWRAVFWANIPVGLAALTLTALLVPDSKAASRRPGPAGQALVIVLLGALAAAIIEAPRLGWASPVTGGLLSLAVLALAALLASGSRRAAAKPWPRLPGGLPLAGACATAVCAVAAIGGFLFLSAVYLQDVRSMSPVRAGLALLPMPAEMAVCAPLAGRLITRRGSAVPAAVAGIALAAGSAALIRLTPASSPGYLAASYSVLGVGAGLASPAITYGIMSAMPAQHAGLASGLNSASRQLGQSLGVAVTGTLLASALHGPMESGFTAAAHQCWWVMTGCGCAVFLLGTFTGSPGGVTVPAWLARSARNRRRPAARRARHYQARHARRRSTTA
jgi:EmrB/QacA subfamily drug resistance transporter